MHRAPGNFLPLLANVDTGELLFFEWSRSAELVAVTGDVARAIWWHAPFPAGDDDGSLAEVFALWPGQGRDGSWWLLLTDRAGVVTWLFDPEHVRWLTRDEFAKALTHSLPVKAVLG